MRQNKQAILESLRARIAAVEQGAVEQGGAGLQVPTGVALGVPLDAALPGGGLTRRGVHVIAATAYGDRPAASGFAAGLAACLAQAHPGPVLWCRMQSVSRDWGGLYGPGLAAFGLDPARLILVDVARSRELLWVVEESLRTSVLSGVIADFGDEARGVDLTAGRRLQLAAESCGTPALLLTGHRGVLPAGAAVTHWRIAFAPSRQHPLTGGLGLPVWQVRLERCRHGAPGDPA